MVGQYQGPSGTAALAVVAPLWNIIYSLGLLMGIGGSVIFSTKRGLDNGRSGNENEYFTVSVLGSIAPVSYTHLDVYKRQPLLPVLQFHWHNTLEVSQHEIRWKAHAVHKPPRPRPVRR